MIPVCIDLETRPRDMTPDELRANALKSSLNKCKKPDTRAAWADDPDNQIAAWARGSVSMVDARIVAWAAIVDGSEVQSWADWNDEGAGLRRLCGLLDSVPGTIQWVGHGIVGFDLPLLRIAAARHRLKWLRDAVPTYRYDRAIYDNMHEAVKPAGRINGVTADALAQSLGLPGKGPLADLDFPNLYAMAANPRSEFTPDEIVMTLERRARVDVVTEWRTYECLTD